jgi:hypothetical protein
MEPLTAGAIAFTTWVVGKIIDWSTDKTFDIASEKLMQLLMQKSPDTAKALTLAKENAALPSGQREDIGEAVLVEKIESAAKVDSEIKAAVEALANDAMAAAKENPQLAAEIQNLTKAVQANQLLSQNSAKLAETIGINTQNISGGEVYQTFGQGGISITKQY